MSEKNTISPITQQLSMYIATALHQSVPDAVCERAKLHIVDTFAAMISGSRLLPGCHGVRYMRSLGGRGLSSWGMTCVRACCCRFTRCLS